MIQEKSLPQPGIHADTAVRKPRLALMGEFSAGKSTLTNLLVGRQPLPVKVTATRLPPVWLSHGPEAAWIKSDDEDEIPVSVENLANVPLENADLIRLKLPAEALELCDLIDMPGISDPNMPASVWQKLLPEVDGVIWCTHATQAWRQSEAAVWEEISGQLEGPNTLLVTHFDKLRSRRDQERVIKRVRKETGGSFDAIFPLSLSQAVSAGEDMEAWKTSGADSFIEYLVDLLLNLGNSERLQSAASVRPVLEKQPQPKQDHRAAVLEFGSKHNSAETERGAAADGALDAELGGRIMPRRVVARKRSRRPEVKQTEV